MCPRLRGVETKSLKPRAGFLKRKGSVRDDYGHDDRVPGVHLPVTVSTVKYRTRVRVTVKGVPTFAPVEGRSRTGRNSYPPTGISVRRVPSMSRHYSWVREEGIGVGVGPSPRFTHNWDRFTLDDLLTGFLKVFLYLDRGVGVSDTESSTVSPGSVVRTRIRGSIKAPSGRDLFGTREKGPDRELRYLLVSGHRRV